LVRIFLCNLQGGDLGVLKGREGTYLGGIRKNKARGEGATGNFGIGEEQGSLMM